jgi:hypothetical protein
MTTPPTHTPHPRPVWTAAFRSASVITHVRSLDVNLPPPYRPGPRHTHIAARPRLATDCPGNTTIRLPPAAERDRVCGFISWKSSGNKAVGQHLKREHFDPGSTAAAWKCPNPQCRRGAGPSHERTCCVVTEGKPTGYFTSLRPCFIKLLNVFVSSSQHVVIGDYGLARARLDPFYTMPFHFTESPRCSRRGALLRSRGSQWILQGPG